MPTTTLQRTQGNGRTVALPAAAQGRNVSDVERAASLIGGGLLAAFGLTRGSVGGLALAALGAGLVYRGASGHCHLYDALGVSTAETHGHATSVAAGQGVKVEKSIVIDRPPELLYHAWHDLRNLPRFMRHVQSVTTQGNRSHWVAKGLLGTSLAWDAEIINDHPNELLAWRSMPGADVDSAGAVHFQPVGAGRGTRVTLTLKYDPPAGKMGVALARMLGQNPSTQIEEDLQRFKEWMESSAHQPNRF